MSSNARRILSAIIVIAVATVALFAYQRERRVASQALEFKVAVLLAQTGNFAFTGAPIRNVLELAVEQNQAALRKEGIDLKLLFSDTQGNPREAITAFNRAVDVDGVNAVISNLSGQTLAVAPLAKSKSVLQFGITIDPAFLKENDLGFRFQFSAAKESEEIVKAIEKKAWKRVLVLYSTDASTTHAVSRHIVPRLEAVGVNVVKDTFNPGQRDLNTLCAKYGSDSWDGVIYHGFGNDIPFVADACSTYAKIAAAPKICAVGCLDSPVERRKSLIGTQLVGPAFFLDPSPEIKRFQELYASRFPKDPLPWHALYAYDIYVVVGEALRKAGTTDARKLKLELQSPHQGLTQEFLFDLSGDTSTVTTWLEFGPDGSVIRAQ